MLFDTLQISKDLQESFSPQQAETLARVLAHAGDDQIVTKIDFSALKADFSALKADFSALKADFDVLKADFTALKADFSAEIAALEGRLIKEISLLRADTIRWIVTAIGFNFLATAGLIIGLVKVFGK